MTTAGRPGDPSSTRKSRAAAAVDFDGDGDIDLLVVNNGQANELFENDGTGGLAIVTTAGGPGDLSSTRYSNGAARGVFDGDGDLDFWC